MKAFTLSLISLASVFYFFFYQFNAKKDIQGGGDQQIYTFDSESIGFNDIQALYRIDSATIKTPFFQRPQLEKLSLKITCVIKTTKIRENTEGVLMSYELLNPNISIENSGFPINTSLIKQEMTHPVLVERAASGQVTGVRIDSAVSLMTADLVKNIVSQMQFVRSQTNDTTWTTDEENTSGTFTARYRFDKREDVYLRYKKTNEGYTKLKSSDKGEKILVDNQTHILVDTMFRIVQMNISESQVVLFNSDTITASANQITLKRTGTAMATSEELQKWAKLSKSRAYSESVTLSAPISEEKMNQLVYKNTLGNDNFETLLAKMNPLMGKIEGREDSFTLKFRALAYLFPKECVKMGDVLKKSPLESPMFKIMSNALASTETPQAINTLVSVIEARQQDEAVVMELLQILAITTKPTDKAINIVKKLAFSTNNVAIASTAQLALGGLSGNMKTINPEKADAVIDFLINKMHGQTDTFQEILVLGNTGSPKVLPIMKSYIYSSASPEIRAAAVASLRLVEQNEVQNLLASLSVSKDSILSKAAIETIDFRASH